MNSLKSFFFYYFFAFVVLNFGLSLPVHADDSIDEAQRLRQNQIKSLEDLKKLTQKLDPQAFQNALQEAQEKTLNKNNNLPDEALKVLENNKSHSSQISEHNIDLIFSGLQQRFGLNDEDTNTYKTRFKKYIHPILSRLIDIIKNPHVIQQAQYMISLGRQKKLIIMQIIFIIIIFFTKIYLTTKSNKWYQNLKINFYAFISFWVGSSLIIPFFVYGSAFKDLLFFIYNAYKESA